MSYQIVPPPANGRGVEPCSELFLPAASWLALLPQASQARRNAPDPLVRPTLDGTGRRSVDGPRRPLLWSRRGTRCLHAMSEHRPSGSSNFKLLSRGADACQKRSRRWKPSASASSSTTSPPTPPPWAGGWGPHRFIARAFRREVGIGSLCGSKSMKPRCARRRRLSEIIPLGKFAFFRAE
jgi:hypothetical protein